MFAVVFQGDDLEAGIKGVSWCTDEGHRLKRLNLCQLLIKLTEEPLASYGRLFFFVFCFFECEPETIYCQLCRTACFTAPLKPQQILCLPLGDSLTVILCTLGLGDFVNKWHKYSMCM